MPAGVGYPEPQPGAAVTDQIGPPAVGPEPLTPGASPAAPSAESQSVVQGVMGQYGVLSPEEQTELRTLITPRFAQLLMKMFGPEMEPHLQPYLADDMAGGMPGEQAPEFAGVGDQGMFQPPGKLDPNIQPAGLTSGDAVGGGTPANALADIYRAGPRPRGV